MVGVEVRVEGLLRRARRLGLDRLPWFRGCLERAVVVWPDGRGMEVLERLVAGLEARVAGGGPVVPLVRPVVDVSGSLVLGSLVGDGRLVGLGAGELVRMVLGVGPIGCGKTSLARLVALQWRRGLVFDRHNDFGFLAGLRSDVLVLGAGDFVHGLFVPPVGVDGERFVLKVCEVLGRDSGLFAGSEGVLAREAVGLLRAGPCGGVLCVGELLERLVGLRVPWQERQYVARVCGRLERLFLGAGGVVNARSSMLPYLLDRLTVVSLDGLDEGAVFVLVSQVLLWLVSYFEVLGRPDAGVPLRFPVLLDEAHYVLGRERSGLCAGESSFVHRVLEGRGRGVGLVCLTQDEEALHPVVRNQAGVRVYFGQGSAPAARLAGEQLWGRDASPELVRAVQCLPQGSCFVKHPRCPDPLLVRVPYLNPATIPYDAVGVRARSLAEIGRLGFVLVPGVVPKRWVAPADAGMNRADAQGCNSAPGTAPDDKASAAGAHGITDGAARFLRQLALDPWRTVKEVREVLRMGGGAFDRVRRELAGCPELIRFVELETGRRGNAPQWARLLPPGFALVGVEPPAPLAKESSQDVHTFWKQRIATRLRESGKYTQIFIDKPLGSNKKKIDVAGLTEDGALHGYEIELQPDLRHVVANVEQDFEAGCARVSVLVPNSVALTRAKEILDSWLGNGVFNSDQIRVTFLGAVLES